LLAPIAPHIAEEMWQQLGHETLLASCPWLVADDQWLAIDLISMPIQVNGKLRATLEIEPDSDSKVVEAKALAMDSVKKYLAGQTPKKVIVVPNRIINVVI